MSSIARLSLTGPELTAFPNNVSREISLVPMAATSSLICAVVRFFVASGARAGVGEGADLVAAEALDAANVEADLTSGGVFPAEPSVNPDRVGGVVAVGLPPEGFGLSLLVIQFCPYIAMSKRW